MKNIVLVKKKGVSIYFFVVLIAKNIYQLLSQIKRYIYNNFVRSS